MYIIKKEQKLYHFNYSDLLKQLPHILENETNFISNCSNFSALLFNSLENLNWVGFYFVSNTNLILGPFQGKPACVKIEIGKGVCGSSAKEFKTIVVEDVHNFLGHIACDTDSNSEIVIPIIIDNELIGVLDIDSPILNRFQENDQDSLEKLLSKLIELTDFSKVKEIYET